MGRDILFISPHTRDAERLVQILNATPLRLDHVYDLRQARARLDNCRYQAILTEAGLPDGAWMDVLRLAREISPGVEVIVTDAFADGHLWTDVLGLGCYDLLAQPFHAAEVRRILSNACAAMTEGCLAGEFYNGFSA